ncbi:MAG TPA: hypothetical protein VG435_08550 [Acidimicrobiales bacterium]|jgi:hypothetical protein|nr:hypothetical protein [Acidimicrobiales bacterium]
MDAKVMLCDFAEVSGNKLFITGAGISLLASGAPAPPYPVNISLATLVSIPWTETDARHVLTIELVSEATGAQQRVMLSDQLPEDHPDEDKGLIVFVFSAQRMPNMAAGDESTMPIAVPMFGLPLPELGPYFFSIRIDGREMDRASFRLVNRPLPGEQPQI